MEQNQIQTAEHATEYKNENLAVSVKRKPACIVELEVQASPALVQLARKDAVKVIAKEVSLPGFRKGRAPDELVLKNYPSQVDKKWQEVIANRSFAESEKLVRIPLLTKETKVMFNMKSHNFKDGASLTLSFETDPEVPQIEPAVIQLKNVKKPEVNEEKVKETIRQTQFFFASWKEITDRPVQEGDFVLLNVDVIEDTPPSPLFSNTRFEVTEKSMAEWMRNLVLGLSTGSSVEGVSTPDKDVPEEERKELKDKKVKVTLLAIESADMPPVDEEFAQKLGVPDVETLHKNITELLNKQADGHVREELREQVGAELLTHYSFELPRSLVDKEANFRLKQLLQDSQFQRHWDSIPTEERRKIVDSLIEQSQKAVRMFYICRKIITDAKLTITTKDLHTAANTPLEALLLPQPHAQQGQTELQQAEAMSRILLEKAEDYIITNATIVT